MLCFSDYYCITPPRFIKLAEERPSRALVVSAYLFSLMMAVDHEWWFRGVATKQVYGTMTLLSSELHSYMEWSLDSVRRPQDGNSEERKT